MNENVKMLKVFVCIVFAGILMSTNFPVFAEERIENIEIFGVEPIAGEKDKGRSFAECLKGWRQFVGALAGYESFKDYWKEIFYTAWVAPTHFSDITNVQDQLNRARYEVASSFLRCDLSRLKSVTEAYYRLEAELYYVRHFVNLEGGSVQTRGNFANELADYLIALKASENPEKERAIYSGYYDLFEGKYSERAKLYADIGDDPVYGALKEKWEELMETFKSFQKLGSETAALVTETGQAIAEGAAAVKGGVAAWQNPGKAIKDLGSNTLNRFKICPTTEHPDECKNIAELGSSTYDYLFGDKSVNKFSEKKTPEDVKKAIAEIDFQAQENAVKADMLARYELLYGRVSGDGVIDLMERMDTLLGILGKDGSLPSLATAGKCAKTVKDKVCK